MVRNGAVFNNIREEISGDLCLEEALFLVHMLMKKLTSPLLSANQHQEQKGIQHMAHNSEWMLREESHVKNGL